MGIINCAFLLLFLFGASHGFVFSCDEVKYQLANSNFQESTQFVCLVLEHGYPTESLKDVYAQVDGVSTSFFELATSECIERKTAGAWRIVAERPDTLKCSVEFSLIFMSIRPIITELQYSSFEYKRNTLFSPLKPVQVTVAPSTGIFLDKVKCAGAGNISVFTGAGSGIEESRYLMKSWGCADLPDMMISFDNVITVAVDDDVLLELDQTLIAFENEFDVSPSIHVAVISSGRSDNLQNKDGISNIVRFTARQESTATVSCSPCTFDAKYDGLVRLTEYDNQRTNTSTQTIRAQETLWTNFGEYLELGYETKPVDPQDLGSSDDNFVIEITFSDAVSQASTPLPIVTDSYPYCSCALDKKFGFPVGWEPNEIWLDIVFIVDTSEAMGGPALEDAKTLVESLLDPEYALNLDTNSEFYTRIGLIAMSNQPEVLFNLNMTENDNDGSIKITKGLSEIDIIAAFNAAQQMLIDGRTNNPGRQNTRQVIYFLTKSDPKSITQSINDFKGNQGVIIVNNFIDNGAPENSALKNLASDGYYYKDIQKNYMSSLQLFCKANCYCLPDKKPYTGNNADPAVQAAGGCFHTFTAPAQFNNAQKSCSQGGGLIASIHDQDKSNFVGTLMRNVAPTSSYFWIGYSKSDAGWKWEDQSTNPYTHWDFDEPSPASVAKCTYANMETNGYFWGAGNCNVGFNYPCEYAPCAVGSKECTRKSV